MATVRNEGRQRDKEPSVQVIEPFQQTTSRPVQFEFTADVRATLLSWLERRGRLIADFQFPGRVDHAGHMSKRQYARLIDEWVTAIGLRKAEYGTHSLRRTKPAMIYRATGNIRAIQILLGHTKIKNTLRYLGLDIEDALLLAERTEIEDHQSGWLLIPTERFPFQR